MAKRTGSNSTRTERTVQNNILMQKHIQKKGIAARSRKRKKEHTFARRRGWRWRRKELSPRTKKTPFFPPSLGFLLQMLRIFVGLASEKFGGESELLAPGAVELKRKGKNWIGISKLRWWLLIGFLLRAAINLRLCLVRIFLVLFFF